MCLIFVLLNVFLLLSFGWIWKGWKFGWSNTTSSLSNFILKNSKMMKIYQKLMKFHQLLMYINTLKKNRHNSQMNITIISSVYVWSIFFVWKFLLFPSKVNLYVLLDLVFTVIENFIPKLDNLMIFNILYFYAWFSLAIKVLQIFGK